MKSYKIATISNNFSSSQFKIVPLCIYNIKKDLKPTEIVNAYDWIERQDYEPENVNLTLSKDRKTIEGTEPVYSDKLWSNRNQWSLRLKNKKDPVIVIHVEQRALACLLDTGSQANIVNFSLWEKLKTPQKVSYTDKLILLGPDGENIECWGSVQLEFTIANECYKTKFYIIKSRTDTLILGYNFLCINKITIVSGKYVTNCFNPFLMNSITPNKQERNHINRIQLKPDKSYEILPRSQVEIRLKVYDMPGVYMNEYIYDNFLLKNCCNSLCPKCEQKAGQVCMLHCDLTFQFVIDNIDNNFGYELCSNNLDYARAIPLANIGDSNNSRINCRVRHISPRNIAIGEPDLNQIPDEICPEYIGNKGWEIADLHLHQPKRLPFNASSEVISSEIYEKLNSCSSCKAKGEAEFCLLDENCLGQSLKIQHIKNHDIKLGHTGSCTKKFYRTPYIGVLETVSNIKNNHYLRKFWEKESFCFEPNHLLVLYENDSIYFVANDNNVITSKIMSDHCTAIKAILLSKQIQNIYISNSNIFNIKVIGENFKSGLFNFHLCTHPTINIKCTLCKGRLINNIVAADKVNNEYDILTDNPKIKNNILEAIKNNKELFATHAWDIGKWRNPVTNEPFLINLRLKPGVDPYVAKFYPVAPTKREASQEIITQLEKHDIIERRVTSWITNAVWVKKAKPLLSKAEAEEKNVTWFAGCTNESAGTSLRLAVNYKFLNSCLVSPVWPLPGIKSIFADLKNSNMISICDCAHAYWGLVLNKESQLLTGFYSGVASDGSFVFKRVAMGLAPSGAILGACLHATLGPLRKYVSQFSDNLIIHSNEWDHGKIVGEVFKRLQEAGMKIKINKSVLGVQGSIKILGLLYNVKDKTVSADPEKVKSLIERPYPTCLTTLKGFLGSIQFLIESLVNSQEPLAILYQSTRGNKFNFGDKEKKAYDDILKILKSELVSVHFINYSIPIYLAIDTSTHAVGFAILQYDTSNQRYRSCGFYTKVLSAEQMRYSPSEREALGICVALKSVENIIMGGKVKVLTDCRAILCLHRNSQSSAKFQRYLSYIDSFDPALEICWTSCKDPRISIADYLSRPTNCDIVLNKKLKPSDHEDTEIRAKKIKGGIYTKQEYSLLFDFILELPIEKVNYILDDTVQLNENNEINYMGEDMKGIARNFVYGTSQEITKDDGNDHCHLPSQRRKPKEDDFSGKSDKEIVIEGKINCLREQMKPEHGYSDRNNLKPFAKASIFNVDLGHFGRIRSINEGTPLKDFLDPTINRAPCPQYNDDKSDKFINFIFCKSPFIDASKLISMQRKDPIYNQIIGKCRSNHSLSFMRNDKNKTCFMIKQGILLRRYCDQIGIERYQLCVPRMLVEDLMIILHRDTRSAHPGAKKLLSLFNINYFSPGAARIAVDVFNSCSLCSQNKPKHCKMRGNFNSRIKTELKGPGQLWFADVIQICNTPSAKYTKALCFCCGFSSFFIAHPFKDNLTNEKFIEIFLTKVVAIFSNTRWLVTDNANDLSGVVSKQSLNILNIKSVTILSRSPRFSYIELLQRYLLAALKTNVQEHYIKPSEWHELLPFCVISLNNTPYSNLKYNLSAQQVCLGQRSDLNSIFALGNLDILENDYSPFVIKLAKSQKAVNSLINKHQKEKQIAAEKSQGKSWQTDIQPGDLVWRENMSNNLKGFNKKLRPRYDKIYYVCYVNPASVFVRPYNKEAHYNNFNSPRQILNNPTNYKGNRLPDLRVLKFDRTQVKKVKTLCFFPPNPKTHYNNFTMDFPNEVEFEEEENQETRVNLEYKDDQWIERDGNIEKTQIEHFEENEEIGDTVLIERIKRQGDKQTNRSSIKKKTLKFSEIVEIYNERGFKEQSNLMDKYTLEIPDFNLGCILKITKIEKDE